MVGEIKEVKMLFAYLLPPPGTRSRKMSVIVHHLLVFGTTSKHTISKVWTIPVSGIE